MCTENRGVPIVSFENQWVLKTDVDPKLDVGNTMETQICCVPNICSEKKIEKGVVSKYNGDPNTNVTKKSRAPNILVIVDF